MTFEESTPGQSDSESARLQALFRTASDLIKRLEGSSVHRLSLEMGDCKLEIERGTVAAAGGSVLSAPLPATADGRAAGQAAVPDNRHAVLAPLVGTFYRAPQPGAKPFVEVGDVVEKGQTVAIVEAMKIMNQIQAEQPGRVAEILPNDGDWVEYHQALMYLEPPEE